MNRLLQHILMLLIVTSFTMGTAVAQIPGVDRDSGTGPDGIMIFPKKLAMFCDISSSDIKKEDTVKNCLNKLLRESKGSQIGKQNYNEIFRDSYRQMNSVYLTDALNKKSTAGDSDDEIDKATEADLSAAGALSSEADNVRKKQEQNAVLYGITAEKTVDVIEIYSSLLALNAMQYYYTYEFGSDSAPLEDEETKSEEK